MRHKITHSKQRNVYCNIVYNNYRQMAFQLVQFEMQWRIINRSFFFYKYVHQTIQS